MFVTVQATHSGSPTPQLMWWPLNFQVPQIERISFQQIYTVHQYFACKLFKQFSRLITSLF